MAGIEGERRGRQGGAHRVPGARAVRQDAAHGLRAVQVLRLARGLHRRRPRDRPGEPGRHPRPQRRRQDDDAADPRRRRPARHRRGRPGLRAQDGLLRPGARDARREPHRAGEHAVAPRPSSPTPRPARVLGSFLFSGDDAHKTGRRAVRRREDPARPRDPRRLERQRAAARRAHQQPRPRLPRGGARTRSAATPARSSSSPTTRARCGPSTPTGCCCCPTATRTSGTRTTPTWCPSPEGYSRVVTCSA